MKTRILKWLGVGVFTVLWSVGQAAQIYGPASRVYSKAVGGTSSSQSYATMEIGKLSREQLIQLSIKLVKEKGMTPAKAAATVLYNLPDGQAGAIASEIAVAVLKATPTLSATVASEVIEAVLSTLNHGQAKKFAVDIAASVAQIVPQATTAIALATTQVVPEMAVDIATALTIANPSMAIDLVVAVAKANPFAIGPLASELAKVSPQKRDQLVTELVKLNPEAAGQIVTSLIVEAGMDSVTALQLVLKAAPSQATNIAVAASLAAPDQAAQIAEALLKETQNFPNQKIQELALSVMVVAPELAKEIIASASIAYPQLAGQAGDLVINTFENGFYSNLDIENPDQRTVTVGSETQLADARSVLGETELTFGPTPTGGTLPIGEGYSGGGNGGGGGGGREPPPLQPIASPSQ